ncbi:MAG: succinyl-diaminopimelate desuccinylase [Micrococcus sp.]|nr:succinyl-diaminopimelate desuccinylase [Micrococcus sp.]
MTTPTTPSTPAHPAPEADRAPARVELPALDAAALDVAELTATLLDVYSVSDHETPLADAVETALGRLEGLAVQRIGDTVIARTQRGRDTRVILAGHLDTVPLPTTAGARGIVPSTWDGDVLYGRGAVDMKSGVAVQLALAGLFGRGAAGTPAPVHDITWVFYDHEEVDSARSGLARVAREAPELLAGDFAVLLEPTDGVVEGGCNGTNRYVITFRGVAAHSGRAWRGHNAIHDAAALLQVLQDYDPVTVSVEGLDYREGLNAIRMAGGVAGNVIPDTCTVEVNYRFAPDKTLQQAHDHVREVFAQAGVDWDAQVEIVDASPAARPGLDRTAAAEFVAAVGGEPKPKYGWTDVARFSELGVPAVNFGPGDALLAHTDDEHVHRDAIHACLAALRTWLSA